MKGTLQNKNVSFDFDDTLWTDEVQAYALELIKQGYVAWIVTSRYEEIPPYEGYTIDNTPVFEVAEKLGIPRKRIVFLNHTDKHDYFIENPDFLVHLDDAFFSVVHPMNDHEECLVPAVWYDPYITKWKERMSAYL